MRNAFGRGNVRADDVLDASAALVTAYRCAEGKQRVMPTGAAQLDFRAVRMEIAA